jgi:hypothetical protein
LFSAPTDLNGLSAINPLKKIAFCGGGGGDGGDGGGAYDGGGGGAYNGDGK